MLDLLHSVALLQEEPRPQCPQQHQVFSAAPMELSFKSGAATVTAVLRKQIELTGSNYLVGQFVFGDLSLDEALGSIALFARHVMPELAGL